MIQIFCPGGISQVDTFDYKPKLYGLDGQTIEIKTKGRGGSKNKGRVVGPKWKFKQHGKSGIDVSDLLPHIDEVALGDLYLFILGVSRQSNDLSAVQ